MDVYCNRGVYIDGDFHIRGGNLGETFDTVDEVQQTEVEIYLPPGTYNIGFQCYDLIS